MNIKALMSKEARKQKQRRRFARQKQIASLEDKKNRYLKRADSIDEEIRNTKERINVLRDAKSKAQDRARRVDKEIAELKES
jgi:septal ring factor EnvC (AmiA/AmiB activator)